MFRWDRIRLNLPGSKDYQPSLPWVSKIRDSDNKIAADGVIFVDDTRSVGNDEAEAWAVTRNIGSTFSYLGLQDASRKRRGVSQTPGAWAGVVVWTNEDGVFNLVAEDKWAKPRPRSLN